MQILRCRETGVAAALVAAQDAHEGRPYKPRVAQTCRSLACLRPSREGAYIPPGDDGTYAPPRGNWRLPIVDCRSKKHWGQLLRFQSKIDDRQSQGGG